MEGRLWEIVLALLPQPQAERGRFVYDNRLILTVLLWAVIHDRPQRWACQRSNWPASLAPRWLPDPSTLCRRRQSPQVAALLESVQRRARELLGPPARDAAIDSRPVVVGGASKDRDARSGRAVGGFGKGYRAHMLADARGVVRALSLQTLNVNDRKAARGLIAACPQQTTRIVGDGNYDSCPLHRLAGSLGKRLYAPTRGDRVGRRRQRERVKMQRLFARRAGRALLRARAGIERVFAWMSNTCCGLKPLPGWVRGAARVGFWIEAKVLFYHAYRLLKAGG